MVKLVKLFISSSHEARNNNINAIRFIAAAMVVYGHMSHLGGFPMPLLFGEEVSSVAVKVFFVLSGYLITQSFLRDDDLFRYGIRRIFRIIPGLIFLVLVTVFLIGPILSSLGVREYFSAPETYVYLKNCFLYPIYSLPGLFEFNLYPNAVNGSLWTLPVEFFMYIILPFFIIILRKIKRLKSGLILVSIIFFSAEMLYLIWFPNARLIIWGTNIFDGLVLAPYFFAGAVFAFPEIQEKLRLQIAVLLSFLASIAVFSQNWHYEFLLFLTLPYITLACSFATPAIFGRIFAINDYSYGLYLWGFLVQQILVSFIGFDTIGFLPYTFVCLMVSLVCAMISWHFVEQPCNILGKRIISFSRKRQAERLSEKEAGVCDV